MNSKLATKTTYSLLLSLAFLTSSQTFSAEKKTDKEVSPSSEFSYITLEKASAVTRTLLSGAQTYTQEYLDLSPRSQAGINLAATAARITNSFAQYKNNDDIKNYLAPHAAWAVYDIADGIKNVVQLINGERHPRYKKSDELKVARILASFIEGGTALAASLSAEEANSKNIRIRLYTACSLARCIERAIAIETKELKVAMGIAALANLALLVYTMTQNFDTIKQNRERLLENYETAVSNYSNNKTAIEIIRQSYHECLRKLPKVTLLPESEQASFMKKLELITKRFVDKGGDLKQLLPTAAGSGA